jgi:glycerate dehydrogenase
VLTPHIAWAAKEARQRVIDQVAENIRAFYEGDRLRRIV